VRNSPGQVRQSQFSYLLCIPERGANPAKGSPIASICPIHNKRWRPNGGGCSLERTALRPHFPAYREINREIRDLCRPSPVAPHRMPHKSGCLARCAGQKGSKRTGILFGVSGNWDSLLSLRAAEGLLAVSWPSHENIHPWWVPGRGLASHSKICRADELRTVELPDPGAKGCSH